MTVAEEKIMYDWEDDDFEIKGTRCPLSFTQNKLLDTNDLEIYPISKREQIESEINRIIGNLEHLLEFIRSAQKTLSFRAGRMSRS